jgi:hypothetical protein
MCGSRGWSNSSAIKLLPLKCHHAKSVSITSNDILSSVSGGSSEQDNFGFGNLSDGMSKSSKWNFSESIDFLYFIIIGSGHELLTIFEFLNYYN